MSLTDWKGELNDGIKAIDGPKGRQKSVILLSIHPSHLSQNSNISHLLSLLLRRLCSKRLHSMLSYFIFEIILKVFLLNQVLDSVEPMFWCTVNFMMSILS